jgi:uncharacterized protein YecA (UPF0149 family)
MGRRFPEFDVWQEEAKSDLQKEWAKTKEIEKLAFEAGGDLGLLVQKLKTQVAAKHLEIKKLEVEVADKQRLLARSPSPRPMPRPTRTSRIGRNDPCPCGSGKKFKHCCMRN